MGKTINRALRALRSREANTPLARAIWAEHNLMRAWRKVKANGGGPGVDGENLQAFEAKLQENLDTLQAALRAGQYQPQPVRRVWVPKSSGEMRPLAILTIRDRVVQRATHHVLAPLYERKFLDCSFGFRDGRSIQDAVDAVLKWRDQGRRWVVDGDIKNCFETLDHQLLLKLIAKDVKDRWVLQLIERWLKAHIFNDMSGRDATAGAFQGGVISPLLANIYLHEFDQALTTAGLALVRFADDWVILCAKKAEAQAALDNALKVLEGLRLALNPYKTRLVHFDQGFRFLGVFFVRSEHFYLSPQTRS